MTSEAATVTRSQAVQQILAEVDSPIALDALVQRALSIYPSTAKNPANAMRKFIHTEENGDSLVFVDDQTVIPLRAALRGVRFRIPLSEQQVKHGVLFIYPAFKYMLLSGFCTRRMVPRPTHPAQ